MSVHADKQAIVLEIGTRYVKCGVSEERAPRWVLRWNVAELLSSKIDPRGLRDYLAHQLHKICFDILRINTRHRRFLICEDVLSSRLLRETVAEVLFVDLKASALTFVPSAVTALFATSHHTALVVDCGYRDARVLPVYKGIPLPYFFSSVRVGTASCCERLGRELAFQLSTQKALSVEALEEAFERGCFVQGYQAMDVPEVDFAYQGVTISVPGSARSSICEHLLGGAMLDLKHANDGGIAQCLEEVFHKIPVDIRSSMMENILLVGGTAMVPGFAMRLQDELNAVFGKRVRLVDVLFPRNMLAWVGASIFAAAHQSGDSWISATEYAAAGSRCLPDWTSIAETETEI